MKKRIVMLVASDPDSDPRIEWEASYAPREFAVTAMGACMPSAQGPQQELRPSYTIVRVPPAATPDEDALVLKKIGRDVAESDLLHTLPPVSRAPADAR